MGKRTKKKKMNEWKKNLSPPFSVDLARAAQFLSIDESSSHGGWQLISQPMS